MIPIDYNNSNYKEIIILAKTKDRTFFIKEGIIYCQCDKDNPPDHKIYKHNNIFYLTLYSPDELGKYMFYLYDTHGLPPEIFEDIFDIWLNEELNDLTKVVGRFTIKINPEFIDMIYKGIDHGCV